MISQHEPGDDAHGSFLDTLSRRLATATSRRDAIGVTLAALFGGRIVAGCTDPGGSCSAACKGSDGTCYSCSGGSVCSQSGGSGCSTPSGGVYCCSGSGGGGGGGGSCPCNPGYVYNASSGKCCASGTPYYYPGTHGITGAGCYASCPYVGDCGSSFTHC